jgi:toxin ParE1/3/4
MAPNLQVRWTKRALSNLDGIVQFIAKDKPQAAHKLAQAIRARTEALQTTPNLGREVMPGLRELVVHQHYLITYRIKSGKVEILQVWHTARSR